MDGGPNRAGVVLSARRLFDQPIIPPNLDRRMGSNVCNPALIAVPDWVPDRLGRYYLYFADHRGRYIRLAYAPELSGPWRTHAPGCLDVADSFFCTSEPTLHHPPPYWTEPGDDWKQWLYPHVASPDVHVCDDRWEIRMYFHGLLPNGDQQTRVAISRDGIHFDVRPDLLAPPYLRAFPYNGCWYGIAMPDILLRSPDGLGPFEPGPRILPAQTRHAGLCRLADRLVVVWSELDEAPERVHYGFVALEGDWRDWKLELGGELMRPELEWEGAEQPAMLAALGAADERINGLRDPMIFEEAGRLWLLYVGGGEHGIGLAELVRHHPG